MRLYELTNTANTFELRQGAAKKSDNPNSTVDDSVHVEDLEENNPQHEDAPPGREKQVKALKGKVDNPYAVAWASYNKSKNK